MKRADIDKKFTQKVAEYLAEGYTICTNSMGGHQGEVAKVDLVKGDTLMRVWLNKEYYYNWNDEAGKFHGDTLVLRVGEWNRKAEEAINTWCTVWMNDLTTIHEEVFCMLSQYNDYYVSMEEAIRSQQIRSERRRAKYSTPSISIDDITNEKTIAIARHYLKKVLGYSRINNDLINVFRKTDKESITYQVMYRSNKITIWRRDR